MADLLSGLVSGGMSLIGSAYQNYQQNARQLQAEQYNTDMLQEQQGYNAQQAQVSRDFSAQQADTARQFDWDTLIQSEMHNDQAQTAAQNFNADQAEKNRQFQQMMSSTAYQRATADMKAAGINPILAYQQGGASTPGGSSASVGAVGGGPIAGPMASGPTASSGGTSAPSPATAPNAISAALSSAFEGMKVQPQVDAINQQVATGKQQENATFFQGQSNKALADLTEAKVAGQNTQNEILKENLKEAKASGETGDIDTAFYGSKVGNMVRYLGNAMKELSPFVSNAKTLHGMVNGE